MAHLPFWMESLTPEMVRTAEVELGETPVTKTSCLEQLRQLIKKEAGFSPAMDDSFLTRFLRAKKYDVKRAFKTLKAYYYFKSKYAGKYSDFTPSELKKVLEMNKVLISPRRDPNGGGVIIIYLGTFDLSKASPNDFFAIVFLCFDVAIDLEASQVCGISLVYDFRGTSFNHLRCFSSPSYLAALVRGVQDCWPYRMKAFHAVCPPPYFSVPYNIIRSLISKKLRDRIHFHYEDMASLHSFLPPECLPREFGGNLEDDFIEEFHSRILSREPLVEKLNKYVYDGKPSAALKDELAKEKL